jgi:hypothetical protein
LPGETIAAIGYASAQRIALYKEKDYFVALPLIGVT